MKTFMVDYDTRDGPTRRVFRCFFDNERNARARVRERLDAMGLTTVEVQQVRSCIPMAELQTERFSVEYLQP